MELINEQSLTLLTTIIAVTSNLLSFNEKIAKNGLVNTLKILSYYVLPIIFLKQIIVFTYEAKSALIILLSIIPILTLFIIKKKKIDFFSENDMMFIWFSFITAILLILQIFIPSFIGIENYNSQITDYINEIKNQELLIDVYKYMEDHLLCTFWLIVDVVIIILFVFVSFKELVYYNDEIFGRENNIISLNYDESVNFKKMFINLLALFFTAGFGKQLVNYVIGLFGFK